MYINIANLMNQFVNEFDNLLSDPLSALNPKLFYSLK